MSNLTKPKILLMGSDQFPLPIFKKIINSNKFDVKGIVCSKRQAIFDNYQEEVKIFKTDNFKNESLKILGNSQPDLILICNFGQIVNEQTIKFPKLGCFNIHCSLLPLLRGACPIEMAILNRFSKTGYSIQNVSKRLDEGDIFYQKEIKIAKNETGGSLRLKFQKIIEQEIVEIVEKLIKKQLRPFKQDHSKATYCYKSDLSDMKAEINWNERSEIIEAKIRAFNPKPGAWIKIQTKKGIKKLKIFFSKIVNCEKLSNQEPGSVFKTNKLIIIKAQDVCIEPEIIQIEGKQKMETQKFLNGFKEDFIIIKK